MTKKDQKAKGKKLIFPSAKIGVEEEFLPSTGTYLDKDSHEVRAAVFGEKYIDKKYYRAKVYSIPSGSKVPRRYDTVVGVVVKAGKNVARFDVIFVNGKRVEPAYSAIMHISDASRDYVRSFDSFYGNGDLVRATVIDAKSIPIQLEAKKNDTGVIYSLCEKCGEETTKIKRNSLKCTSCGWKQTRNTAIDYGRSFS
jgi:exosome complex component CSL4